MGPWIQASKEPALAAFLDASIRCTKYSTESIMHICHSGPSLILYVLEVSVVLCLAFGDIPFPRCYTSNQNAGADGKNKVCNRKRNSAIDECSATYAYMEWTIQAKALVPFLWGFCSRVLESSSVQWQNIPQHCSHTYTILVSHFSPPKLSHYSYVQCTLPLAQIALNLPCMIL